MKKSTSISFALIVTCALLGFSGIMLSQTQNNLVSQVYAWSYFNHSDPVGISNIVISEVATTSLSIDVAVDHFTSVDVAKRIQSVSQRSNSPAKVRIILNPAPLAGQQDSAQTTLCTTYFLNNPNIAVRILLLMQSKYAIIDSSRVLIGSASWTNDAFQIDSNSIVKLQDNIGGVARAFQADFDDMWQDATPTTTCNS